MQILKAVLGSHSLEEFLSKHFHRLPLATSGNAKDFKGHLNWEVVEKILQKKTSILRIVKDEKMVKDFADVNFQEAYDYYQAGHTLVIKNAEKSHPLLESMAKSFSSFFYGAVDIQVFCSPKRSRGFTWHYDVEDVFIFQTQGSKHFTLRQNTFHPQPILASLDKDLGFDKESSKLFIEVDLKEGDWLYIPSGWWHKAETFEEESMHISLGVMPTTACDMLTHLEKELAQNPSWRTRFPLHHQFSSVEEEVAFYQEGIRELGEHLVKKMSDPDFIKNLLEGLRQGH